MCCHVHCLFIYLQRVGLRDAIEAADDVVLHSKEQAARNSFSQTTTANSFFLLTDQLFRN